MPRKAKNPSRPAGLVRSGANAPAILVAEMRLKVLEAAGFTPERLAELARDAAQTLHNQLDATSTQYYAYEGVVTDEREVADHSARTAAAKALIQLASDIAALKADLRGTVLPEAAPKIEINMAGWFGPEEPKNVTPSQ